MSESEEHGFWRHESGRTEATDFLNKLVEEKSHQWSQLVWFVTTMRASGRKSDTDTALISMLIEMFWPERPLESLLDELVVDCAELTKFGINDVQRLGLNKEAE